MIGVYVLPLTEPRDPGTLSESLAAYIRASGLPVDRLTEGARGAKTRALRLATLRDLCLELRMHSLSLWNKDVDEISVDVFVRDMPQSETDDISRLYERRHGHIISNTLPLAVTDELRAWLIACSRQASLAHGFIANFEHYADAMFECMSSHPGPRDRAPASEERRIYDRRRYHEKDKLRRLYPVTIIGPAIWAQLPPMPAFDPMPKVEGLGDCKLVTAWPTLCEPRDPEFLRGTRALREWLWPYTIQNPADHVDRDPPVENRSE